MLLRQAKQFSDELETLASSLNYEISLEDLMVLSEINSGILFDIEVVQEFFATNSETKLEIAVHEEEPVDFEANPWLAIRDCNWKTYFDKNWMVSEYGDIYDIDKHELKALYFIDGDMRVLENEEDIFSAKRAAPIVTKCFGIKSGDRDGRYIVEFIDGDRRNLSITNLRWIPEPSSRPTDMEYIIDDICRRLVDFNGDVTKTLEMYKNSSPVVSKTMIQDIKQKKTSQNISDRYFTFLNGSFFARPHVKKDPTKFSISEFFVQTGDLKLTKDMIQSNINNDVVLQDEEVAILVYDYILNINKKCKDPVKVQKHLQEQYGLTYPLDYINEIMLDDKATIAKVMRGEI